MNSDIDWSFRGWGSGVRGERRETVGGFGLVLLHQRGRLAEPVSKSGAAGDRLLEVLIDLRGGMHRGELGLTAPDGRAETLVGAQVAVGDGRGVLERRPARRPAAAYALGGLAAWWLLERTLAIVAPGGLTGS